MRQKKFDPCKGLRHRGITKGLVSKPRKRLAHFLASTVRASCANKWRHQMPKRARTRSSPSGQSVPAMSRDPINGAGSHSWIIALQPCRSSRGNDTGWTTGTPFSTGGLEFPVLNDQVTWHAFDRLPSIMLRSAAGPADEVLQGDQMPPPALAVGKYHVHFLLAVLCEHGWWRLVRARGTVWLEQRDMEDVVDAHSGWQLKAVCHAAYFGKDLERAHELGKKLARSWCFECQVARAQQHIIPDFEVKLLFVSIGLLTLLGNMERANCTSTMLLKCLNKGLGGWDLSRSAATLHK